VATTTIPFVPHPKLTPLPTLPTPPPKPSKLTTPPPTHTPKLPKPSTPATLADLEPTHPARARLAFDELLATQLPAALRRAEEEAEGPLSEASEGAVDDYLTRACEERLPFAMTRAQRGAVAEAYADIAAGYFRGRRMVRLLQGDVGSGKTVCALLAMLRAVELGGGQAALLAPTEILAFQHQQTLAGMCEGLRVRVEPGGVAAAGEEVAAAAAAEGVELETRPLRIEVLTSSKGRGKARRQLLESLGKGGVDILVGTHALLGDDVLFNKLGLVVIDEEHRFGVKQREKLSNDTNVLYMSATPIPRTLLLASYGDMEVRAGGPAVHEWAREKEREREGRRGEMGGVRCVL
jgi:ATP-dependent DNA helicase RecG